jgi:hypothetical protein
MDAPAYGADVSGAYSGRLLLPLSLASGHRLPSPLTLSFVSPFICPLQDRLDENVGSCTNDILRQMRRMESRGRAIDGMADYLQVCFGGGRGREWGGSDLAPFLGISCRRYF